jgi:hypothetical protein
MYLAAAVMLLWPSVALNGTGGGLFAILVFAQKVIQLRKPLGA